MDSKHKHMYVHANEHINKQIEHIEMQQEESGFNLIDQYSN